MAAEAITPTEQATLEMLFAEMKRFILTVADLAKRVEKLEALAQTPNGDGRE